MKQLNSINTIASLLSRFVVQVKGLNAINQYGINMLSETVLIPLLNEIFECDLKNLNSESNNFPGIDLGDKIKKVAFQITSNADSEKIKNTLESCVKHDHFKTYNKILVYCLTEKPETNKTYSEFTQGKFQFNAKEDVLDFRDLLKVINSITDSDKIVRIENLLSKQFSELNLENYNLLQSPLTETVYSNLLKISFPQKLYTATITIKRKDLKKKTRIINDRQIIFQYKKENNLKFSSDWIDHNKQLYSFHDLSNHHHEISKVIDLGTVESMSPEEFYLQSKDHERAFKALLKFCFAKYANFLGIEFKHEENLFVFISEDENKVVRSESWHSGKRNATREVIRMKRNKKTNDVWYYTHLAFSVSFKYYNNEWFLEITPDWYITKDGTTKHYYRDKDVTSWLKRNERNLHVFNNTKFIANYLKYGKLQSDLFQEAEIRRPKNFIELLKFESFRNSPLLNEDSWKTKESEEIIDLMKDKDGVLESEL
ncbi:MAG: SMEK domain-containing protein [Bacteroidales bacterium]|nr:SMEK domain-containing protein [Bacteroidales bacterium]